MSATRLKLARTNLAEMEEDRQTQLHKATRHHQTPAKSPDREKTHSVPQPHFTVGQVVYDPDGNWPAWKRAVFRGVYLPLFRFFDERFKFFPPHRKEPDGSYSWLAFQGCFFSETEAQADKDRYPFGFVVPDVPLGQSLTADSTFEKSHVYYKNKEGTEPLTLAPIVDQVIEETRKIKAAVRTARAIQ